MPSWYSIWSQTEFWRFHKKCLLLGESWQLIVKILMLWWRSSVQFQQLNCWECLFIFSSCQNSTVNRIVAISPNFVMKSQNMPVFVKKKCALQILQQFKYVCPLRSWNIHDCSHGQNRSAYILFNQLFVYINSLIFFQHLLTRQLQMMI